MLFYTHPGLRIGRKLVLSISRATLTITLTLSDHLASDLNPNLDHNLEGQPAAALTSRSWAWVCLPTCIKCRPSNFREIVYSPFPKKGPAHTRAQAWAFHSFFTLRDEELARTRVFTQSKAGIAYTRAI